MYYFAGVGIRQFPTQFSIRYVPNHDTPNDMDEGIKTCCNWGGGGGGGGAGGDHNRSLMQLHN